MRQSLSLNTAVNQLVLSNVAEAAGATDDKKTLKNLPTAERNSDKRKKQNFRQNFKKLADLEVNEWTV